MMQNTRRLGVKIATATAVIAAVFAVAGRSGADAVAKPQGGNAESKGARLDRRPSHRTHMRFISTCRKCAKKDCTNCHTLDRTSGNFVLNEKACDVCHVPVRPKAWNAPGKARSLRKIKFKHTNHLTFRDKKPIPCAECHSTTMKDAHVDNTPAMVPDTCFTCHSEEKTRVPQRTCVACHEEQNKAKVMPSNHTASWRRNHGEAVRWDPEPEHGKKCTQCHGQTACVACHRSERPASHTGLWRERLHGKEASWDRERCKTCHETGACISCHRRTPPLNHRGDWVANHKRVQGFEEGCTTCHSVTWCRSCHAGQRR